MEFISQIQVEEDTSPSGVGVRDGVGTSGPRDNTSPGAAGGGENCLWDLLTVFEEKYLYNFFWIRPGIEREVHPPSSTEAGDKLASVDINTRRISLQTRLAGVEQFVVPDDRVCCRKVVLVTAKISKWRN